MKSTNLLLTDRVGATASHNRATLRSGVVEAVYTILIKSDMMERHLLTATYDRRWKVKEANWADW